MSKSRKVYTTDCETDPFVHGRVPKPFIWGLYDGADFEHFDTTEKLLDAIAGRNAWVYAHNGGKFDFLFMLPYLRDYSQNDVITCKIIKGRLAELPVGKAKLRDSYSIIPTPLADFQKTDIDYSLFEKGVRDKHMAEIRSYLLDDCRDLFELVSEFRNTAGKGLTIAGNALNFAKKLDIEVGRTSRAFDKKFRQFYNGGRCEAFQTGHHAQVSVWDIKSAYPFAMTHDHATGKDYMVWEDLRGIDTARVNRMFIHLSCKSKGAFPVKRGYTMSFPHEKGEYFVTGWEYNVALEHGLITDINIIKAYEFYDTISFTDYVDHWFATKEKAEKDGKKALRHVAKIMLNSLYGKLCQDPSRYEDYKVVPLMTPQGDGWRIVHLAEEFEIHSRPTLYRLQAEYGDQWEQWPLYYNVATGSSITGFTRAMLLNAIHNVGIDHTLYCDTDSLILGPGANCDALHRQGALGAWQFETNASPCYIAGKKLYGYRPVGKAEGEEKIASKGGKLTMKDMKSLCEGETVRYNQDAPTMKLDGSVQFVTRTFKATGVMKNAKT